MNKLLFLVLLGTLSLAQAHTQVTSITPDAKTAVAAPKAVLLTFSEPIALRFSTFRVMAVPTGKTLEDSAKLALSLKADAPELATRPFTAGNMAARLRLPLKPGLKSGTYVIAWKILSDDGHPVSGQSVFTVK
ncbi:copper resistance protein CopC [Deinococcus irradiatisoli]|uniref:Copper resistance protein CopC n=1 Tax=Deinococcus irradiatisoli TaxID=2202254 RepID=A0A2Z3JL67_9DEIO|nr:copper resistance CopC family protein [Deinococcus irradiatisoli]AWN24291.1 copper resistance protein CopC [Deinococcus irradiatisoli]